MPDAVAAANDTLRASSPALHAALSPLGAEALFPPDIPFQAAQARGKAFNGTIGQITDGHGGAVALPSMAAALEGLDEELRHRALLYSPVEGLPEVRRRWREWQRRHRGPGSADAPSSLPVVVDGLTHGLSVLADLFGGPGRAVAVSWPFWGNYRQTFVLRTGARLVRGQGYRDGRFNPRALAEALAEADLAPGEPALAILNLPSNPGGYMPTPEERAEIAGSLLEVAEERPLVVICDDAYAGLVYGEGIPETSMFWDLMGLHPQLVPVKVDGATKEFSLFGGRVGFLTFPLEPDDPAAAVLESKVKCMVRAAVGSPVALGQVLLLEALRSPDVDQQVAAVRDLLARRWQVLRKALAGCDPQIMQPLPANAGCFALVELAERVLAAAGSANAVRQHLLETQDVGLVSIEPGFLRIAHCSVDEAALPELVARTEAGLEALAG